MARFTAPANTPGIHLTAGYFAAKKGVIEVPDDLSPGDRAGLGANGFTPAPNAAPKPEKPAAAARPNPPRGRHKPAPRKPETPASKE